MAIKRPPDYHDTVYHFIRNHVQATGEFPPTYLTARRMNPQYRTVYNCLIGLENRGLIERRIGKRTAGFVQCEKRRPPARQPKTAGIGLNGANRRHPNLSSG